MTEIAGQIDLGRLTFAEGFFLLRSPRPRRLRFSDDPVQSDPYRHVFTYVASPQTIKDAAIAIILEARKKVFVASFLIGDTDLLAALYSAAGRLRGGVYVISALDEGSLRRGLAESEAEDDPAADDKRVLSKRFEDLTRNGIYVRGHENCHAKFIVVDDRIALVSSANLVTRAFRETGENGAVVTTPDEVTRLARFFARLWASCTYEMPPGEAHTVQQRAATASPCAVPAPEVGHGTGLIWTYPNENVILATLHDIIGRARRELLLATFGLTGLTENTGLLIEPLARAIEEYGPSVKLLVRARNNMAGHRKDAAALAALGVTIYADSLNHAKGVIADEEYGALFSANFDAKHGLDSGVEMGVRLDGTRALREATRYFRHAMQHSDLEFDPLPTQTDMDERLGAGWRKAWPLGAKVRVTASPDCWHELLAEASQPPVLYSTSAVGAIELLAGSRRFRLNEPDSDGVRKLSVDELHGLSAAKTLQDWLVSSRRGGSGSSGTDLEARGFCPAVIERV